MEMSKRKRRIYLSTFRLLAAGTKAFAKPLNPINIKTLSIKRNGSSGPTQPFDDPRSGAPSVYPHLSRGPLPILEQQSHRRLVAVAGRVVKDRPPIPCVDLCIALQ